MRISIWILRIRLILRCFSLIQEIGRILINWESYYDLKGFWSLRHRLGCGSTKGMRFPPRRNMILPRLLYGITEKESSLTCPMPRVNSLFLSRVHKKMFLFSRRKPFHSRKATQSMKVYPISIIWEKETVDFTNARSTLRRVLLWDFRPSVDLSSWLAFMITKWRK